MFLIHGHINPITATTSQELSRCQAVCYHFTHIILTLTTTQREECLYTQCEGDKTETGGEVHLAFK